MRMAILLCAWLATGALAQEIKYVQRVVEVKYVDPQVVVQAMYTGSPVKDGYAPQFRANRELGIITVYGTAADVDQIVANIKALDKPSSNGVATRRSIDARLYILVAGNVPLQGDPLPKDLDPVADRLKSIFPFADIRLLDIAMFRSKPGQGPSNVSGRLPCQSSELAKSLECSYSMRVNLESVTPATQGTLISLENFVFEASFFGSSTPGGTRQQVSVTGRFDLLSGQKVVIGKSRIDPDGRNLVLVLTGQPVD